jgi:hypothetical protein
LSALGRLRLAAAAVLVVLALIPSNARATGQTYTVVQCHPLNRAHANAILEDASPYAARAFCGDPQNDYAIKVTSTGRAQHGSFGRVRWPTGSPALGIVSVDVRAKLRRDNSHTARLWMADPNLNEVARIATGGKGATAYRHYGWDARGHGLRQFVASLSCERPAGCRQSNAAKTWVRDVRLNVADYSDPRFTALSGTLLETGWLRGSNDIHASADDLGSGLHRIVLAVNGARFSDEVGNCGAVGGTSYAAHFKPCSEELLLANSATTAVTPFTEGANVLSVCGIDFAGNRACERRVVKVDNTPPAITFTNFQNPEDPELIRARVNDATSGVSSGQIFYRPVGQASWRPLDTWLLSGQLWARIDSTIDPPGEYEFKGQTSDVAGNATETTSRADGQPMILTFPLKSGVKLNAHLAPGGSRQLTVGYGQHAKVAGQLRDSSGKPLAKQWVTVTEYFGAGALIDRRIRTVRTDPDGLWGERLPAGPTRTVRATYDGTSRYLADTANAGRLRVKTKATFHLSRRRVREGRRVVFRGRVAHFAARIPAGGKLIELQVKDGSHWHTVRHVLTTRANGRYRMRYRFARFYTSNVSYRFRIKVLRESGWPYKAPVSSRARRLVVSAR